MIELTEDPTFLHSGITDLHQPVWDIFCQVIDNWGDAGVCWRLCKQLQEKGISARLWIDDPTPLAWMNPPSSEKTAVSKPQIQIVPWDTPMQTITPASVLIEAFGCRAPDAYLEKFANQPQAENQKPVWLNLEYLSAQPYAAQCHGLPSPQQTGPAQGLTRWFYYPGFTPDTGGLLREPDLIAKQQQFDRHVWLAGYGIHTPPQAQLVSLFCYPNRTLPLLLEQWQNSKTPVHLFVTAGASTRAMSALLLAPPDVNSEHHQGPHTSHYPNLTVTWLPLLPQAEFDHLLWSCDLNMVRGEDSWIRAIWAGKPFIWQPYVQDDGEHLNKLHAFLSLISQAPQAWLDFEQRWTQKKQPDWNALQAVLPQTNAMVHQFREQLMQQPDLASALIAFVKTKASASQH